MPGGVNFIRAAVPTVDKGLAFSTVIKNLRFSFHFSSDEKPKPEHRRRRAASGISLSWETMPESREQMPNGGYWIRRVDYSPTAMEFHGKTRRLALTNNKENIPRGWRRSPAGRYRRTGKSPLPEWYPRTPLRDITSIVKAYERRRALIQAAAAQSPADSPAPHHLLQITDPSQQESSSTPPQPPMKPQSYKPTAPQTPAAQTIHVGDDAQAAAAAETALLSSMEQIEKAVKRNMKAMKKPESKRANQLRNLMSMR
ncbi:hypothetical protein KSP39_PZI000066 [Platanthera zijinensis]|uniref:Uncharacterized protein n=1 Tax=Platanthera zijinensis TaxID=2320716 RepID=A0AAP0GG02_9ASPA